MAKDFPITEAQLVNMFLESLFYGIYLVNFGFCLPALLRTGSPTGPRWKYTKEIKWGMLSIAVFMFANNTAGLFVALWRCIDAFVLAPGGPMEVLANPSEWPNVFKVASVLVQALICDGVLIHRSFVVWSRKYWVIVPSTVLWMGGVACLVKAVQLQGRISGGTVTSTDVGFYLQIFWALTSGQNIFTTSMLVWRLWRVDRQNREFCYASPGSPPIETKLQNVMRIVIESGLLYTVTAFLTFLLHTAHSNGVYPAVNVERLVAAIAFNLILIRTAHRSDKEYVIGPLSPRPYPLTLLSQGTSVSEGSAMTKSLGPAEGIHITVSQEIRTDGGHKTRTFPNSNLV